ncbi:C-Myc-binding protein, putative [Plasmodium knowlesi strain H]|uniref:c-Myc-binding protein, putative n=3 Tax=Plasmodium knowlesi TaxID=5850 RepID=A0A5K1V7K5_PLAKH|nr:C-Myc-binding protein, putative [Plasmodium knowlesi strain H]OTN64172.1 putative c-Myc-binding protein [Plasmodium knowlesi]CAA9990838.1 C-Myc-binding protein, putative [Plasmodium knowlesi strain H]SBO20966.1 C-Myc-binding protein, putative [Plasmodium knowlesi strain H]SBO21459.1 C-Myc-binding protein, putative [Plasmodium knowlesi strain H]VVS80312.1 C-Myc-binding protein, putative [Plasmodium knowlesi strain H]|eukprot:XP_002262126.1 hypothetical protein, conserved in Plasmodium species [Plasmodium knowlesi strain H]
MNVNMNVKMNAGEKEFITYLEEHGVIDQISRALLQLFQEKEKPKDAIKFISDHLQNVDADVPLEDLKRENSFLREENQRLTRKFEELNDTLNKLLSSGGGEVSAK